MENTRKTPKNTNVNLKFWDKVKVAEMLMNKGFQGFIKNINQFTYIFFKKSCFFYEIYLKKS